MPIEWHLAFSRFRLHVVELIVVDVSIHDDSIYKDVIPTKRKDLSQTLSHPRKVKIKTPPIWYLRHPYPETPRHIPSARPRLCLRNKRGPPVALQYYPQRKGKEDAGIYACFSMALSP